MDVVNVTAMPVVPVVPVGKKLAFSGAAQDAEQGATRKNLEHHVPSCIIGSIHQVNQKIAEMDLTPHIMDSSLAIERLEFEKKALREKSHSNLEDLMMFLWEKSQTKSQDICSGSASKNVRSFTTKRQIADKNLLAELYQYPQFDNSKPNELPNGVDFCDMVARVVQAERNPLTGKIFCSVKDLERFLSSPPVRGIWLDSFWWIFHERYQPDIEVQNKLFERISLQYAFLLFTGFKSYSEEAILKRLPSLLSKALYTSFCSCFSQSWLNTHEFKSHICNTVSLWISGICPSPLTYDSWDYSKLDPERFWREELILGRRRLKKGKPMSFLTPKTHSSQKSVQRQRVHYSQSTRGNLNCKKDFSSKENPEDTSQTQNTTNDHYCQDLDLRKSTAQVKKISEARAYEDMLPKKSHPARIMPKMTSNFFNIYGKSPLIVYFLLNYSTLRQAGKDVLVVRREITEILPESTLTYAGVINLTLCNMKKRRGVLHQFNHIQCTEWAGFDQYMKELHDSFLREVKNLDQREADKKKANRTFIQPPVLSEKFLAKKPNGNYQREIEFLVRKEKKAEERKKLNNFFLPPSSPDDLSSLDSSSDSSGTSSSVQLMSPSTNLLRDRYNSFRSSRRQRITLHPPGHLAVQKRPRTGRERPRDDPKRAASRSHRRQALEEEWYNVHMEPVAAQEEERKTEYFAENDEPSGRQEARDGLMEGKYPPPPTSRERDLGPEQLSAAADGWRLIFMFLFSTGKFMF